MEVSDKPANVTLKYGVRVDKKIVVRFDESAYEQAKQCYAAWKQGCGDRVKLVKIRTEITEEVVE